MSAAAIAEAMEKAGCTAAQIVQALKDYEEGKRAKGRASNARRQAEYRARRNQSNGSNGSNAVTQSNENNAVTSVTETPCDDATSRARSLCEDNIIKNKTTNVVLQKGSRIDGCWSPQERDWHFAIAELGGSGADRELAKFRDYWISTPGAKGRKLDWSATWRNWVRSAAERLPRAGPSRRLDEPYDPFMRALMRDANARPDHDNRTILAEPIAAESPGLDFDSQEQDRTPGAVKAIIAASYRRA